LKTLRLIQSRTRTPNYYLFSGLQNALKQSNSIELTSSAINGFQKNHSSDILLSFGGEEALNPLLETSRSFSTKSAIWYTEDPYEIEVNTLSAENYNLVFTTDYYSKSRYRDKGNYLTLGVPGELFDIPREHKKIFDIVAFGSLWPNRLEILEKITSHPRTKSLKILLLVSQAGESWVDQETFKKVSARITSSGGEVVKLHRPLDLTQLLNFTRLARVCINWPRLFKQDSYSVPGPRIAEVGSTYVPQLLDVKSQPAINHMIPKGSFISYSPFRLEDDIADALEMSSYELGNIGEEMFDTCQQHFDWNSIVNSLVNRLNSL